MQTYTLDELITIERVATRAVNAAKAFAEGADRAALEDLLTLVSEVRHAASCTQAFKIHTADLWVAQEARFNEYANSVALAAVRGQKIDQVVAATGCSRHLAELELVAEEWSVEDALVNLRDQTTQKLKAEHLDRCLVRTDN